MKRDFYTKFGIIMAGLFVVPLFTLTVQATYLDIDGDISVDISGSIDKPVQEYKLYVPEVSLKYHETDGYIIGTTETYKVVPGVILKSNATIESQIAGKFNEHIANFEYCNSYYEYLPSQNKFDEIKSDFSVNPRSDIYLKYDGYFARGSSQSGGLPMNFDKNTGRFTVNGGLVGNNLQVFSKTAGTTEAGVSLAEEYSVTSSGKYSGFYDTKNNDCNFYRNVYLEPGVWTSDNWFEKSSIHMWGNSTADYNPARKETIHNIEYWVFEADDLSLDNFVLLRNDILNSPNKTEDLKFTTQGYSDTKYKLKIDSWGTMPKDKMNFF